MIELPPAQAHGPCKEDGRQTGHGWNARNDHSTLTEFNPAALCFIADPTVDFIGKIAPMPTAVPMTFMEII